MNRLTASGYGLAVLVLLLAVPAAAGRKLQPWEEWQRNPVTIAVTTMVTNLYADDGSVITVTLSDGQVTQAGAGWEPTNAPPFTSSLKVRKEYVMTVESDGLSSAQIALVIQGNWTPLHTAGRGATPKEYHLLIDRELSGDHLIPVSWDGSAYSNAWVVEIVEQLPAQWRLEDGSDDPKPAPGDGVWAQIGPGKSLETNRAAIAWSVGLGRLMDGVSAGRLSVRETGITRDSYTPKVLYYTAAAALVRDQVELIPQSAGNPVLRQVKVCQTFVDIVTLSTNETELRFYLPTQIGTATNTLGHYTNITGNPFVVWEVHNPEPATTNKLNIVERRNSVNRTNEIAYQWTTTNGVWTLRYGTGTEQRVETRTVSFTTASTTNRIETVDIRHAGAAAPAYHAQETYRLYPWGFELVETRVDPDNNPGTSNDLVTTINFNTDPGDEVAYKQVNTILNPDGSWEKRLYDFVGPYQEMYPLVVLRPYGDSPATPDEADEDNSVVTPYASDLAIISYAPPYSAEKIVRWEYNLQVSGAAIERSSAGEFINSSFGWWDPNALLGEYQVTWGEAAGFGYYRHPVVRSSSSGPAASCYYNSVTYNPTNHTYTLDTNQPAWEGPDWRGSSVYTVTDTAMAYGFPDENDDFRRARWADGQELFDPVDFGVHSPWFVINQSWRDSEVYHKGSLVLLERSVFTNATENWEAEFDLVNKWVLQNDSLGHTTNVLWVDGRTGVSRVIYSADYRGTNAFDGDLLLSETDESGVKTVYTYDTWKRVRSRQKESVAAAGGFPAQSAITTTYAYDAAGRIIGETNRAASLVLWSSGLFDTAGRRVAHTDTNGLTTTLAYELGGRRIIRTFPSGATEIREHQLDGRLKSVTGTGVVNEFHDWDFVGGSDDPYLYYLGMMDTVHYGSSESSRVVWQGYDLPGRLLLNRRTDWQSTNYVNEYLSYWGDRVSLPRGHYRTTGYTPEGQEKVAVQLAEFDLVGTATNAWLQFDGLEPSLWLPAAYAVGLEAGYERLARFAHRFAKINGDWFAATTNMVYRSPGDSTATIVGVSLERLSGFASGNTLSEVKSWDADTNLTLATVTVDRAARKLTQVVDSPQSTLNATNITRNGLLQWESTATIASPTRRYQDALGRETQVVSPLGFSATIAYNLYGQVAEVTDFTGNRTVYEYFPNSQTGAGQVKSQTRNGKQTFYSYTSRGELHRSWGHVPYPEERLYSDYGELVQLRTFRGGSGWENAAWPTGTTGSYDTTTWTYDGPSGLLVAKTDAQGQAVTYTYNGGLLHTRTWARVNGANPVTLTNTYNGYGEIVRLDYSDATPAVELNDFSRTGQPQAIVDAAGTSQLLYDHASRLVTVAYANGLLAGLTVSNRFDGLHGRDRLQVLGASPTLTHLFGYDGYGRLSTVTNGVYSATYGYLPNADLLATTTCKSNSATILTTSRSWQYGMRLGAILNEANGANVSSHGYTYDSLNRRTRASLEDGSYWQYDYNDRNELTGARRYWPDQSPLAGQHFGYEYDSIGNRKTAQSGGDVNGGNLRSVSYTANGLNQYTSILTPGYEDILGVALATQSVTVNGGACHRKGEYFRRELQVGNGSGPLWTNVTVASGGTTNTGGLIIPDDQQTLTYDLDGNLTFDGVWRYEWDAENRLAAMTMTNVAGIANANRLRLEFAYDFMNRRVQKVVKTWNGSTFVNPVTNLFIYDGWNLIATLNSQLSTLNSFLWGQDLSGTMDQAGGIGGLLLVTAHGGATTNCFVAYDGNGNVMALVRGGNDPIAARYEYSAYGELLRMTGLLAKVNPLRWSTKFWDEESGLVYCGYRYYDPDQGRWLSRDLIEEAGGLNLYGFVFNSPVDLIDALGTSPDWPDAGDLADVYTTFAVPLTAGIADAVGFFNAQQQFIVDVMDSAEGNSEDLYINLLMGANLSLSQDLFQAIGSTRAASSVEFNKHHVLPNAQEFAIMFDAADINPDHFAIRINSRLHDSLHRLDTRRGRGGRWNADWRHFMNDQTIEKTKSSIKNFAQQMLQKYNLLGKPYINYNTGREM